MIFLPFFCYSNQIDFFGKRSSFVIVVTKVGQYTSLIFCVKIQWHKDLKSTSMFFWKSFLLKCLVQKRPKKFSKWRFSSFQVCMELFWIFCMRLQQHRGLKLIQMVFCEKCCTGVFGQKGDQNKFYGIGDW